MLLCNANSIFIHINPIQLTFLVLQVGWNYATYRHGLHCPSTAVKSCNTRRKPYPSAILCTTNQTCTTMGMKPSLPTQKLVKNHLN